MASEAELEVGLEFIAEGQHAVAPKGASEVISPQALSDQGFLAEVESVKEDSRRWTGGEGIQGLGLGEKIRDGEVQDELALRVYVDQKRPPSKVTNPVPKKVEVPVVGTLITDVLEIGSVEIESYTGRARPAMPGCGLGHLRIDGGTLGCLVRKRSDPDSLYILSNSHVLAEEGLADLGDSVIQPGKLDGGGAQGDAIARLSAFIPFEFGESGFPNLVDAAIAKVSRRTSVTPIMRVLGITPVGVGRTLRRGMRIKKVGRTTDYTTGVITDVHFKVALAFRKPGNKRRSRVGFGDQVLCTRYSGPGDSGSVVLNSRNRVVGLHFAGSPSVSVFNRIEHVLRLLDIEVVTEVGG